MFCSFTRPEVVPPASFTTPYMPCVTCSTVSSESGKDSRLHIRGIFQKVRWINVPPLATAAIMRAS